MTDMVMPRPATRLKVEWKTLGLIAGQWLAFGLLIFFWRDLGWWIVAPLGACLVCLHGSLQHEALHGHPTSSRLVNEALLFPPISLWFPYRRYRALHLKHHDNDHLTDPAFDPESYYLDPQAWSGTPRPLRALYSANNAMLGRFVLGPAIATSRLAAAEARRMMQGDREVILAWALHGAGVGLVWWFVSVVSGMPFWQYVLLIAYWGNSLTLMRSYAEHRAHDQPGCRTIVVETNPVVGLLYLNNNLHMAHHERPGMPWYELPGYYRAHKQRLLSENCAYLMRGYGEIARRWGLRPKEPVAHPMPESLKRDG
jgi:fatty acid desaturase